MVLINLDQEELVSLTGKTQHRKQERELAIMGIPYRVRGNGSLVVLRVHVEDVPGATNSARVKAIPEPNWGALR